MIQGTLVNLRPLERDDLGLLVAWRNDPEIRERFFSTFPFSKSGQDAWFSNLLTRDDKRMLIIETKEGRPIGTIGMDHIDFKNQRAEFGNLLIGESEYLGKNLATDGTLALLKFAFQEMNLNRVYLEVYADNDRARRLYDKCGFKVEGVLRQAYYHQGRFQDTVLMSVLRDEFRQPYGELAKAGRIDP